MCAVDYVPTADPCLLFILIPAAFALLPFGQVFLSLFLLLFLFAILTSSFSLYEIIVSAFTASGKYSRKNVSISLGIILFIASIYMVLSSCYFYSLDIFFLYYYYNYIYFVIYNILSL